MRSKFYRKEGLQVFAFFFIFTFLLFFFISSDSYTHDIWYKGDAAWFYMSGKAWMNGLVPYVDITDSKGPLLFFIYGIGYLLSPRNYLGVFWISVFWYAAIFFICYKLANLFLSNKRLAIYSSLLMAFAFFMPYRGNEFRAEDLCMLFSAASLYLLCKVLYVDDCSDKQINKSCFIIGISLAATFLIKFSVTAVMGILPIIGLVYLIREKKPIIKPFFCLVAGLLIMFLTFVIYMLATQSLDDFLHEYILNTLDTVKDSNAIKVTIMELTYILVNPVRFLILAIGCLGCLLFTQKVKRYRWAPMIAFLWFMLFCSQHTYLNFCNHYFIPAMLFFIFFDIMIISILKGFLDKRRNRVCLYSVVLLSVISENLIMYKNGTVLNPSFFIYNNGYRKQYYDIAYLMSQVKNPTYINWAHTVDMGYGIPVNSLPGTKYNTEQGGCTPEMRKEQTKGVMKGKADFITVAIDNAFSKHKHTLEMLGYKPYYTFSAPIQGGQLMLFSKHHLRMPPKDFHVSNMDVLLKRKITFAAPCTTPPRNS